MLLTANNIKIVTKMNFAAYFDVSFHTDYLIMDEIYLEVGGRVNFCVAVRNFVL